MNTTPFAHFLEQLLIVIIVIATMFYLQELPTSNVLQTALPEWPYVLALYFSVSSRYFFGVTSAFIVGLVEDVFLGVPAIGIHALTYMLSAFVIISIRVQFKQMTILLQSLVIGAFVLSKVIIIVVYNSVFYSLPAYFWMLLSVPASVLLWPLIHAFFSFFASRYDP